MVSGMQPFTGQNKQRFEAWWPSLWLFLKEENLMLSEKLTLINGKIQGEAMQAWQVHKDRTAGSVKKLVNYFLRPPFALAFSEKCPELELGQVMQREGEDIMSYRNRQAVYYQVVTDPEQQARVFHHNMWWATKRLIQFKPGDPDSTVEAMLARAVELERFMLVTHYRQEQQEGGQNKDGRVNPNQSSHPHAGHRARPSFQGRGQGGRYQQPQPQSRGGYQQPQPQGRGGYQEQGGYHERRGYTSQQTAAQDKQEAAWQAKKEAMTCFACGGSEHQTPYTGYGACPRYYYLAKAGLLGHWDSRLGASALREGEEFPPNLQAPGDNPPGLNRALMREYLDRRDHNRAQWKAKAGGQATEGRGRGRPPPGGRQAGAGRRGGGPGRYV